METILSTAENIFDFDEYYSGSDADKKRDAFCKILYYQHLLGDLIYDDEDTLQTSNLSEPDSEIREKERGLVIAFAYAHPGKTNKDIFWELSDALETLFADQNSSYKYSGLISKLNLLAREARALSALPGGINTRERVQQRLLYEKKLLELLESYLPLLLDDEEFFRNAFPI